MNPEDRYIVITADSHAGGSHEQYREYLDPKYRDDFDAWRNKYKNPFKDLKDTSLRTRNWDGELRDQQQNEDGVVGEVIFPNTVPPFFPNFVLFAQPPTPDEYEHRHAGVQAHNRWLADYVAEANREKTLRAPVNVIIGHDLAFADTLPVLFPHAPGARDCVNRSGACMYRSANTEVLGFIAEAVTGKRLAPWYADVADAAGIEGILHIAVDRTGFPIVNGGIAMSARDLCRYGLLLARGGAGWTGARSGRPRSSGRR